MAGRGTGTEGERAAGRYIESELQRLGFVAIGDAGQFLHPFEFTAGAQDNGSAITWAGQRFTETDVTSLAFSATGEVSGPVVFAGYGITVPESQDFGYDSYFGIDVKDKIVLVLRYFPEDASQETRQILARYSGLRYKAMNARERGAKGMLVVIGPRSPNAGELVPLRFDTAAASSGIPAASVSGDFAAKLFLAANKELESSQESLDDANPHSTGFQLDGVEVSLDVRLTKTRATGYNVIGRLPATSPSTSDVVVLGGHYDHLGVDGQGSSLASEEERGTHHAGADDNASGVAAVLRAGEILTQRDRRRDVILALWSGEEMGLLGSSAFIESNLIPVEDVAAYLNFDMVGRMQDNRLILQAVGSSTAWKGLIEQTNIPIGFDLQLSDDPYLPTDSTTFNQAKVPTLNFFTGGHAEYHRPSDTPEKINFDDLDRVADFAALLATKLTALDSRPDFVQVAQTKQEGGSRDSVRAFTGTIPDYASDVEGLLLSGVIEGGPAEEAGLRGGDVIVEFGAQKITNIYDYTFALDAVKIDVPVEVVFLRDGKRVTISLVPRARK